MHPEEGKSQERCQQMINSVQEAYRHYCHVLQRKKNIGSKDRPTWISVSEPYMGVPGRIRMAVDEHRSAGKSLSIDTEFIVEGTTKQTLCKATVFSEILGRAVGHARVFTSGGVNESNPLENAETSAVGRALGFLGYGILGDGIASAEEVAHAAQSVQAPQAREVGPTGDRGTAAERAKLLNACLDAAKTRGMSTPAYHEYAMELYAVSPAEMSRDQLEQFLGKLSDVTEA